MICCEAEVHLEEGVAERHALLQPLAGLRAARLARVGVAIHAHAVAEFSAEHLVDRNAIGLAGEVPERDLDRRDAAALPAVAAELLDAPEQPVDVAGVLAEQPALQHEREGGAGAVAHLAEADDALVGVDLQQRGRERRADDLGDPHVGDPKLGRFRIRVDPVEGFFRCVLLHRGVLILIIMVGHSSGVRHLRGPSRLLCWVRVSLPARKTTAEFPLESDVTRPPAPAAFRRRRGGSCPGRTRPRQVRRAGSRRSDQG